MNDTRFARGAALGVACLLIAVTAACTQTPAPKTSTPSAEMIPEAVNGVQILNVPEGFKATSGELKRGDIVVAVGDRDVRDLGGFEAILAEHRTSKAPLELVIVRDRRLTSAAVAADLNGVEVRPWAGALELLLDFVSRKDMDSAAKALDAGVAENRLTPAQALVGRIALVPRDKPEANTAARSDLVKQLAAASSPEELKLYATQYFLGHNLYEAAAETLSAYLQRNPEDFSARLNLAVAQTFLGKYAEAEREIARVEKDGANQITPQGLQLADQARGWSALARKDYPAAAARFEAMLERQPPTSDFSTFIRYLYALARSGDAARFASGLERLKVASQQYSGLAYQAKLLEAFALAEQGKRTEAAAIAASGEQTLPQPVIDFWKVTPGGDDVLSNWNLLRAAPG